MKVISVTKSNPQVRVCVSSTLGEGIWSPSTKRNGLISHSQRLRFPSMTMLNNEHLAKFSARPILFKARVQMSKSAYELEALMTG